MSVIKEQRIWTCRCFIQIVVMQTTNRADVTLRIATRCRQHSASHTDTAPAGRQLNDQSYSNVRAFSFVYRFDS